VHADLHRLLGRELVALFACVLAIDREHDRARDRAPYDEVRLHGSMVGDEAEPIGREAELIGRQAERESTND
jgi:hypothetical protein